MVKNVTATASGGSANYCVYNYSSSSPTMSNVTATASGGSANYGVFNYSSSSPTMSNVTATASGGTHSYGVYNYYSSPTMSNVTATASGGSIASYGVLNYSSSSPKIRRSTMDGTTGGLYTDSTSTATVSQSTIIGGVNAGTGTKTCVACDNGSGTALNGSCTTP